MNMIKSFVSPGEAIKYLLDRKNWTQEDFAQVMSISVKHANELIKNKKPLSLELIFDISKAFTFNKDDLHDFIFLYANYKIKNIQNDDTNLVSERAKLFDNIPISEMVKKGWLDKTNDYNQLISQCKNILGIHANSSNDLIDKVKALTYRMNYKKTDNETFKELHAILWRRVAEIKAEKMVVPALDKEALLNLLSTVSSYTLKPDGIKTFIKDLNKTGVRFIYLSHLSKTYIDGAAFLSSKGPVIAMTGRYDRIDNFWFTISHEILHVLRHLQSNEDYFLDDTTKNYKEDRREKEANEIAASSLKSPEILNWFRDFYGYIPKEELERCSKQLKIHISCIVGILAFNEKTSWATVNRYKESVRDKIPSEFVIG